MTGALDAGGDLSSVRRLSRPGVALALGTVGGLTWVGGHVGFLGGIALVAAQLATTPRYAFAVGHLALVAATGGAIPDPLVLGIVEALLFGVLLTPGPGRRFDGRFAVGTAATTAGLSALAWASLRARDATWIAAGVVLAVAGLVGYGVHRYEVAALGAGPASGTERDVS